MKIKTNFNFSFTKQLIADHECSDGYNLTAINQICGTQQWQGVGEVDLGGPNWPSATSTDTESQEACAEACNERYGCTHYMWFADKGCRTQSSCSQTVTSTLTANSIICEKGIMMIISIAISILL